MLVQDYIVFFFYVFGMLAIGGYYAYKAKSASDMFAAGGQSPWWVAGLSGFMTMFSAGTFVVWGGLAYKFGVVAIVVNLAYGVAALLVGWLVAGKWREMGLRTPAQFVELRFGLLAVQIYTWFMMLFRLISAGIALYALAVLLSALIPLPIDHWLADARTGNLSVLWATIIFGAVVVIYTMAGGLWAVLMTDVMQFIVLNLAVLFMVPLMLANVGGVNAFLNQAPQGFFDLTGGGYGWLFIIGWVIIHMFVIGAEWAFTQRFISVPSPNDAKKSAFLFGGLYLVSPFLWLAPPLIFRSIDPGVAPEEAYILAAKTVLPAGLVGLMLAAMFSATASMVSSQLNVFAGVLSDPIVSRMRQRDVPETHTLWVGRVFSAALGVALVGLAAAVPYLGGAEKLIVSTTSLLVGPLLAPSFWALLNRKIDLRSVLWTLVAAAGMGVVVKAGLGDGGFLEQVYGLGSASSWVQSNGAAADLLIGVAAPMCVLGLTSIVFKDDAPGAKRIDTQLALAASEHVDVSAKSGEAGVVVSVTLSASAALLGLLSLFSVSDRILMGTFSGTLFILAAIVFLVTRDRSRGNLEID